MSYAFSRFKIAEHSKSTNISIPLTATPYIYEVIVLSLVISLYMAYMYIYIYISLSLKGNVVLCPGNIRRYTIICIHHVSVPYLDLSFCEKVFRKLLNFHKHCGFQVRPVACRWVTWLTKDRGCTMTKKNS